MRYVISVGANLQDPRAAVAQALEDIPLNVSSSWTRSSSLYATSPVGGPAQPDFVNAVIIVETELEPADVLRRLQFLESQAGRTRDVRWGPRTLDLDIIDVAGVVSDDPNLTLPHPRAHQRGFVLIPWVEIDPDARLSTHGPVRDLVASLDPNQTVAPLAGQSSRADT